MKRVGIYSGTFDPVHEGHIAFAMTAVKACRLDKVFFLVEPRPRRKQGIKSFEHRTNMVRLAIDDNPKLGLIVLEQARFTVLETLPQLHARFRGAVLFMLMGEDVALHLSHWPHIDDLINSTSLVVGLREGKEQTVEAQLRLLEKTRAHKLSYQLFKTNLSDYSSSKIRASLRKGKLPLGLHPEVAAYIKEQGLYASEMTS